MPLLWYSVIKQSHTNLTCKIAYPYSLISHLLHILIYFFPIIWPRLSSCYANLVGTSNIPLQKFRGQAITETIEYITVLALI